MTPEPRLGLGEREIGENGKKIRGSKNARAEIGSQFLEAKATIGDSRCSIIVNAFTF